MIVRAYDKYQPSHISYSSPKDQRSRIRNAADFEFTILGVDREMVLRLPIPAIVAAILGCIGISWTTCA